MKKAFNIFLPATVLVLALGCLPRYATKGCKVKVDYSPLSDGLYGCISGKVFFKETGEPLFGAGVEVLLDSSTVTGAFTDSAGFFKFCDIRPCIYSVRFSGLGLTPIVVDNIRIESGTLVRIEVELELDPHITVIQ